MSQKTYKSNNNKIKFQQRKKSKPNYTEEKNCSEIERKFLFPIFPNLYIIYVLQYQPLKNILQYFFTQHVFFVTATFSKNQKNLHEHFYQLPTVLRHKYKIMAAYINNIQKHLFKNYNFQFFSLLLLFLLMLMLKIF